MMASQLWCVCAGFLVATTNANMYDVVMPHRKPPSKCTYGCALWSDLASDGCTRKQADVDKKWSKGKAPVDAGRNCAMPSNDPGQYGDWCYCKNSNNEDWDYCLSPDDSTPEQINLQMVDPTMVTVNFVTFTPPTTAAVPTGQVGSDPSLKSAMTVEGVTHKYVETGGLHREYYMHFVRFGNLTERTRFYYRVAGPNGAWSDVLSFTSLYSSGLTKFAVFGDMGVYSYNNMGNMFDDMQSGLIDAIVHLGDHAYNIAQADGRRGDCYMNGYQPLLSSMPWIPVIGNHEYYEGDEFQRFLNMSSGVIGSSNSSSTSALNTMLTLSTLHGRAAKQAHYKQANGEHSSTSRFYSEDIGLVHFISLDFSPYYFADTQKQWKAPQLTWFEADLKSIDRTKTPWVIVGGHFPLYCSSDTLDERHDEGLLPDADIGSFKGCTGTGEGTVEESRGDLEPLMLKYGVDIFVAGHEHDYESIWPVAKGQLVAETFVNPPAPVHFVTGAGGPPGMDHFGDAGPWDRKRMNLPSYGRIIAYNATTLTFQQVFNANSTLFDEVTITKDTHGPYTATLAKFYPDEIVV